jgi:hypothetical protein
MLRNFLIGAGVMALFFVATALVVAGLIWVDGHLGTKATLIALAGVSVVIGGVINAVFG